MQLSILTNKASSSIRDVCDNNGIRLGTESRVSNLRVLRQANSAVSPFATCVQIVTVKRAIKLLSCFQSTDPRLVRILEQLRDASPPPVYARLGRSDNVTFFERQRSDDQPLREANTSSFPVTLPVVHLTEGERKERYGIPFSDCPRRLRADIREYVQWATVPVNTER